MKKLVTIIIILTLIGSSYFLIQRIIPMTPGNILGINITELDKKETKAYYLNTLSTKKLLADLKGSVVQELPDNVLHSFELSVKYAKVFKKTYKVYFDAQRKIIVQDMKTNRLTKVDKSEFFLSHEGFESIYPPIVFDFSKLTVTQGEVIKICVYNASEKKLPFLKQTLFKQFKFYKNDLIYVGSLPTGYLTEPGKYEIEYGVKGGELFKKSITINARDFQIQHLTIDKKIDSSTRNDAANEEYNKYFKPAFLSSGDEIYYRDAFVKPVLGRISTEYGQTRYVNGSPTSYHHSGLDIAAPKGTAVKAVNNGKVVLSMFLTLTGNTIVIDHGQGLFSIYYHLHERFVAQGDMAKGEQQIGLVGTTGFSTGPHLHFAMSYYNQFIEPGYFLIGEPITNENYNEVIIRPPALQLTGTD